MPRWLATKRRGPSTAASVSGGHFDGDGGPGGGIAMHKLFAATVKSSATTAGKTNRDIVETSLFVVAIAAAKGHRAQSMSSHPKVPDILNSHRERKMPKSRDLAPDFLCEEQSRIGSKDMARGLSEPAF